MRRVLPTPPFMRYERDVTQSPYVGTRGSGVLLVGDGIFLDYQKWLMAMRCSMNPQIYEKLVLIYEAEGKYTALASSTYMFSQYSEDSPDQLPLAGKLDVESLTFVPISASVPMSADLRHQLCIFLHRKSTDSPWLALCCDPNFPDEHVSQSSLRKVLDTILSDEVLLYWNLCLNINCSETKLYDLAQGLCFLAMPLNLLAASLAFNLEPASSMDAEKIVGYIEKGTAMFRRDPDALFTELRRGQAAPALYRSFASVEPTPRVPDVIMIDEPASAESSDMETEETDEANELHESEESDMQESSETEESEDAMDEERLRDRFESIFPADMRGELSSEEAEVPPTRPRPTQVRPRPTQVRPRPTQAQPRPTQVRPRPRPTRASWVID